MDGRHSGTDVLIIGAGPSGCATAIWLALQGVHVIMVESQAFPRYRPGETLHPGVEIILKSLGVHDAVLEKTSIRHEGYYSESGDCRKFNGFGKDGNGNWKGYQILRIDLDQILLKRAKSLGVVVLQPASATKAIQINNRVVGLETTAGPLFGKFVVDGSGASQVLRKCMKLPLYIASSRLFVRYGYHTTNESMPAVPLFKASKNGWIWTAKISDTLGHWTELTTAKKFSREFQKDKMGNENVIGKTLGADMTWRSVSEPAGPGYFLTGDAAMILDPAVSRGVLRAMYSGIMAASAILQSDNDRDKENQLIIGYKNWMNAWFKFDCDNLSKLYKDLGIFF